MRTRCNRTHRLQAVAGGSMLFSLGDAGYKDRRYYHLALIELFVPPIEAIIISLCYLVLSGSSRTAGGHVPVGTWETSA